LLCRPRRPIGRSIVWEISFASAATIWLAACLPQLTYFTPESSTHAGAILERARHGAMEARVNGINRSVMDELRILRQIAFQQVIGRLR
jgi:hypothetical protein